MRSATFKLLSCLLTAAVGLFAAASAQAQVCRVTEAGTSSGDGSHWDDEPMDLGTALGDPGCGEIWLKTGVYKPNGCFVITRDVQVYGGFAGSETSRSQRDPAGHPTVLSGDIDNDDIVDDRGVTLHWSDQRGANSCVLILGSDGPDTRITAATVLDGLIITAGGGGSGSGGNPGSDFGGGFVCRAMAADSECSPTLNNVSFYGNSAAVGGGAMFNFAAVGGVSRPVLRRTTFVGNRAQEGGAMYNWAFVGVSSPVLFDATFHDNLATRNGGAVYNIDEGQVGATSPEFYRVTFSSNRANGALASPWEGGGAMYNHSASGVVRPLLENVTFTGNIAPGIPLTAHGADGGAIRNFAGGPFSVLVVTLNHVTLTGNSASRDGGAIASDTGNVGGNPVTVILDNVIAWGNTANPNPPGNPNVEIYNNGSSSVVRDSIVKDGCPSLSSICSNVINADPLLGPLAENGGPTQTRLPAANSPAIDAGNSATCASADQRGVSRTQGGACDLGAVERIQGVELSVAVAGQGQVDAAPTPEPFIDGIVACDAAGAGQAHCRATYDEESKDNILLSLAPAPGWQIDSAEGCDGELAGSSVSIGALLVDCTVEVGFAINQYTVTPVVTAGMGSLSPDTAQSVAHGSSLDIVLAPAPGWGIGSVSGCGGSLSGNTWSTGAITGDCEVSVSFVALLPEIFSDGFE